LAGPGRLAIVADPVADVELEGLEGGIGLEEGDDLAGEVVVDAAVGAGVAVGHELDVGGGGGRRGVEVAAGALAAGDHLVEVLGSGGEARDGVGIQVVGGVIGGGGGAAWLYLVLGPQRTVKVLLSDHCQNSFISVLLPVRIRVGPLVRLKAVQVPETPVGV